ncbi:MAG: DNA alkylation repair protein [Cyclobacteriaceae bacterium]
MSVVQEIRSTLNSMKSPKKAAALQKHFMTAPGEYAAGDKFLGIDIANQKTIAQKNFETIGFAELSALIRTHIHEHRMTALLIVLLKFNEAKTEEERKEVVDFYLDHLNYVNNWDLVDTTAEKILGVYLLKKDRMILINMAKSRRLWRERLALLATIYFVRYNDFNTSFEIIKTLHQHPHDLIHQAIGKVMKEICKRDAVGADEYLSKIYRNMPPALLKHAISGFESDRQQAYKTGQVKPAE